MEKQLEQQELQDIIATREDGFGHRFKTARDAKNLSVDDVARKLHLDKKIILALESEDHTQLPVAAFVCGYIRNYAKLLKIQPEPLVEYYKNDHSDNTPEPDLKANKNTLMSGYSPFSNALSAIAMPVMTVLILVALAAGGWQVWLYISNNYLSSESVEPGTGVSDGVGDSVDDVGTLLLPSLNEPYEPPVEELLEQDSLPAEGSLPVEGSLPAEGSQLAEGSLPAEGSQLAEGSLSAEGSQLAEGSLSAEGSQLAEGSSPAESAQPTDIHPVESSLPTETLAADSLSAQMSTQAAIESAPASIVKNQLIVEFSGNSWVSIKDANDKILATGLKKSPKMLRLDGKLPYKVFLGDARVVKISINGKVFDHSKYINKKNIARFNVK